MATRPRRWWERLLLVTNLVVANAIAGLWIATFLQPRVLGIDLGPAEAASGIGRAVVVPLTTSAAYLCLVASVVLLLCNFAWLVRRRPSQLPDNWLISESPTGPVRIVREAIEAGLRHAGESLPEITRVRVQLHKGHKRIRIVGQFHCAEGQNHLAASQRLRQVLRDRFAELVRLADGVGADLELEFQGFAGKVGKHAPEVPPVEDPAPFTGPRYPIDDDSGLGSSS